MNGTTAASQLGAGLCIPLAVRHWLQVPLTPGFPLTEIHPQPAALEAAREGEGGSQRLG